MNLLHFVYLFTGKGDLIGSDISLHLASTVNGQLTTTTNTGQDILIKSSSDVKVISLSFAFGIEKSVVFDKFIGGCKP